MSVQRSFFVIALALGLLAPATATAAQRYASPTGSGSACTQASPCDVPTATDISLVNPGDEVILLSGTYTSVPQINIVDANVTLHGEATGARPTIQSSANWAISSNQTGTSISHLNVEHTGNVTGVALTDGSGALEDLVVRSTGNACSFGDATSDATASLYTMKSSICATTGGGNSGITLTTGDTDLNLRNVTAVSTATVNAHGLRADSDAGETMTVGGTNVIAAANQASDVNSDDVHALSNGAGASSTITLDHSNYDKTFAFVGGSGGFVSVTPVGTSNNQAALPVFVNAATGDFHQAGGSPTIEAGVDNALNGLTDIDGEARPSGTLTDIGADEFVDGDSDTVPDASDNCPFAANTNQANNDGDGQGDACDSDDDNDTVLDGADNCQFTTNTDQADNDGDLQGDACDADDDNDTITDASDNCQFAANVDQANNDGDSEGDVCDADDDNGAVADGADNCPVDANTNQANADGDGQGDACDSDDDNDTVDDVADNCATTANAGQSNNDADAQGDACDADDDNDGVVDGSDNCPLQAGDASNGGCAAVVDLDPPDASITSGPDKRTEKTKAKFRFTSDEANSRFECQLDDRNFKPCASPRRYKHLDPGKHVFRVLAIDAAGNRDPSPAKRKWKVLEG